MDDREAFLAAVIANPDDDTPRLVYADWLEERGTEADLARARLIRLQVEADRLPGDDDRRAAMAAECDRLIDQHWREWTYGFQADRSAAYFYKATFRRGFLPYMCLDAEDLADPELDAMLEHEPITQFFMRRIDTFPDAVAGWRHLPRVHELSFSGGGDNVKALLRSPLLTGLRVLEGSGVLDEDDVTLVATDPRFAGLTHLGIGYNDLPDRAVEVVARSPTLSRLAEFDYSGNRTTAAALQALASSPLLGRLTVIGLRQYDWGESPRLGRGAADLLAGFRGLRGIDLHGQQIGDDGAAALARSPHLAGLRRLQLGQNALGVRGVTELLSSPHLAGLEEVDLSNNPPGGEWVPALAAAGPRPLRKLVLEDNQLDARAAAILSTSDALGGLRELSLRGNPIGDRGAVELAQSTRLVGLRKLKLQSCGIADEGAAALADSPALARLAGFGGLGLSNNRYGPETARRLSKRFGYEPDSY